MKYRCLFTGNLLHYFSPSLSLSLTHTHTSFFDAKCKSLQLFYVFIIDGTRSSLLCGLFSSCCEGGGLLWLQASHCDGFFGCRVGTRALGCMVFSSCRPGLSSWGSWPLEHRVKVLAKGVSCSVACGIFLDQGLNPGLLHWWVDSSHWATSEAFHLFKQWEVCKFRKGMHYCILFKVETDNIGFY